MDFIINHSGFLFGIVIVTILAIIGYYADKKDKSKNIVNTIDNKEKNNDLNNVSVPIDNSVSFDQLPNVPNKSDDVVNEIDGISTPNSDTNVSDIVPENVNILNSNNQFGFNDFESLNMSLEDLEKKNFDKISKSNLDDENFYYSDMEEPNESVSIQDNVSYVSSEDNKESSIMVDDSISDNVPSDNVVVPENENFNLSNDSVQNNEIDKNVNDSEFDDAHIFDSETESIVQSINESQEPLTTVSDENNDFNFMPNVQSDINNSIPELVDTNIFSSNDAANDSLTVDPGSQSLDLENSVDEDIWKF